MWGKYLNFPSFESKMRGSQKHFNRKLFLNFNRGIFHLYAIDAHFNTVLRNALLFVYLSLKVLYYETIFSK